MVDIVKEKIECANALNQARLEPVPLVAGDRARNQVEGKDLFGPPAVGIHRESNAIVDESQVGERSPLEEFAGGKPSQPVEEQPAIPMRVAIRGEELVPCLGVAGVITKQQKFGVPFRR